jgi:hydroxymethylpyrimidine/phosphomethylpyrimidine kinase
VGVSAIHPVPPEIILAQVRAVVEDIGADAVKVGMLGAAPAARAVAQALEELSEGTPVVVDPVMVSESGAALLDARARRVLVERIVPLATVLTPNMPEARALAGVEVDARTNGDDGDEQAEAERVIRAVLELGPRCVVLTGGHRARAVDLFLDADGEQEIVSIAGERHPDGAAHGSGCTHSAVLAAQLALGRSRLEAARVARTFAGAAIAHGLRDLGAGSGPVDVLDLSRMRTGRISGGGRLS